MTYASAISSRIKNLCRERKISINQLAIRAGLNQSTVDNIVHERTKSAGIRSLHLIAQGFQMTVSELLNFDEMNNGKFEDE